jgi:hypothetical protein
MVLSYNGFHLQELRRNHCVTTTPPKPLQLCQGFNHMIYGRHSEVMLCLASPQLLLNCYLFQTYFTSHVIFKNF